MEDLAATMLATTMGIQFDPETAWDESEQLFKTSGLIIKTTNVTQSATVLHICPEEEAPEEGKRRVKAMVHFPKWQSIVVSTHIVYRTNS